MTPCSVTVSRCGGGAASLLCPHYEPSSQVYLLTFLTKMTMSSIYIFTHIRKIFFFQNKVPEHTVRPETSNFEV
jgi:hypothetical protein